jgi:hypothetical protein
MSTFTGAVAQLGARQTEVLLRLLKSEGRRVETGLLHFLFCFCFFAARFCLRQLLFACQQLFRHSMAFAIAEFCLEHDSMCGNKINYKICALIGQLERNLDC